MNTILFPTDFSTNANNALDFAVNLALKTNSKLVLMNSYELPYSDTVMTTTLIDVMRKNSEEQLEEEKEQGKGADKLELLVEDFKKDRRDVLLLQHTGAQAHDQLEIP